MGNGNLLCWLGFFEDLEMGSLSVQVCLHLLPQHLKKRVKQTKDCGHNSQKSMLVRKLHLTYYVLGHTKSFAGILHSIFGSMGIGTQGFQFLTDGAL